MPYKPRRHVKCKVCAHLFTVPNSRDNAKFCSKQCWATRGHRQKKCFCGVTFTFTAYEKKIWCTAACMWKHRVGDKSPHYKGGVSTERERPANAAKLRKWRDAVMIRDKFTCLHCGTKNRPFHAHHILFWSTHPEKRFDVQNGATLCVPCHSAIHGKDLSRKERNKCKNCSTTIKQRSKYCLLCYRKKVKRKNKCNLCEGPVASAKTKRCRSCVRVHASNR